MSAEAPSLFDSAFLAKIEQLHLLARRLFRGERRAERRSRAHGSSLEFADHREYTPGDELRSIDWSAFGRLDRLFVKLFEHEQDLPVSFLVDASSSMRWQPQGARRITKLDQSRKLTAALAYIALANLDALNIHFLADGLLSELGVARGKAHFHSVLEFLSSPPAPGRRTDLLAGIRTFTQRVKRRGLVIVISDFFDPSGFEEPLAMLRHCQFETHVLHVLDAAELTPVETGDLRLVECETGAGLDVTSTEALLRRYRAEIATFNDSLQSFCVQRGIGHARVTTDMAFENVVLRVLRGGVMLK